MQQKSCVCDRNDTGPAVLYDGGLNRKVPAMNDVQTGESSALFGRPGHTGVSRGLSEFHARRPVLIASANDAVLALPVEGLDGQRLSEFTALCGPATLQLVITGNRALALGLDSSAPMTLSLSAADGADAILSLVVGANYRLPAAKTGGPGRSCRHSTRQIIARPAGGDRGGCDCPPRRNPGRSSGSRRTRWRALPMTQFTR